MNVVSASVRYISRSSGQDDTLPQPAAHQRCQHLSSEQNFSEYLCLHLYDCCFEIDVECCKETMGQYQFFHFSHFHPLTDFFILLFNHMLVSLSHNDVNQTDFEFISGFQFCYLNLKFVIRKEIVNYL